MSISRRFRRRNRGLSLIELIVFIVIVSVALAGVLTVLNQAVFHSADPMVRKQLLSIAESVLEEVESMPFTYCDPDDSNAATANSTAGCAGDPGPEPYSSDETRGSNTKPWDNVIDYDGRTLNTDLSGVAMPAGYSAAVAVSQETISGVPASASLRIAVTVSGGGDSLTLEGYRTRHSPNFTP